MKKMSEKGLRLCHWKLEPLLLRDSLHLGLPNNAQKLPIYNSDI